MKSYEQGRGSFEGTSQHVIWLDEECPMDVYGECLIRLMTTQGVLLLTFTPLEGMSETVLQFQLASERATLGQMG
jgi:phage terminase large subunit-like protein